MPVVGPVQLDDVSACSKTSGSRLAAGKFIRTLSPAFMGQPAYSMSSVTSRAMVTGA